MTIPPVSNRVVPPSQPNILLPDIQVVVPESVVVAHPQQETSYRENIYVAGLKELVFRKVADMLFGEFTTFWLDQARREILGALEPLKTAVAVTEELNFLRHIAKEIVSEKSSFEWKPVMPLELPLPLSCSSFATVPWMVDIANPILRAIFKGILLKNDHQEQYVALFYDYMMRIPYSQTVQTITFQQQTTFYEFSLQRLGIIAFFFPTFMATVDLAETEKRVAALVSYLFSNYSFSFGDLRFEEKLRGEALVIESLLVSNGLQHLPDAVFANEKCRHAICRFLAVLLHYGVNETERLLPKIQLRSIFSFVERLVEGKRAPYLDDEPLSRLYPFLYKAYQKCSSREEYRDLCAPSGFANGFEASAAVSPGVSYAIIKVKPETSFLLNNHMTSFANNASSQRRELDAKVLDAKALDAKTWDTKTLDAKALEEEQVSIKAHSTEVPLSQVQAPKAPPHALLHVPVSMEGHADRLANDISQKILQQDGLHVMVCRDSVLTTLITCQEIFRRGRFEPMFQAWKAAIQIEGNGTLFFTSLKESLYWPKIGVGLIHMRLATLFSHEGRMNHEGMMNGVYAPAVKGEHRHRQNAIIVEYIDRLSYEVKGGDQLHLCKQIEHAVDSILPRIEPERLQKDYLNKDHPIHYFSHLVHKVKKQCEQQESASVLFSTLLSCFKLGKVHCSRVNNVELFFLQFLLGGHLASIRPLQTTQEQHTYTPEMLERARQFPEKCFAFDAYEAPLILQNRKVCICFCKAKDLAEVESQLESQLEKQLGKQLGVVQKIVSISPCEDDPKLLASIIQYMPSCPSSAK